MNFNAQNNMNETTTALDATLVDNTKYNTFAVANNIHFTGNNWMEGTQVGVLNEIDKHGGAIWLSLTGEYGFRNSPDGMINYMPASKLQKVLAAKLKKVIYISEGEDAHIKAYDLLLVSSDTFNPFIKQEFYEKGGEIFRNKFRPTIYMELDKKRIHKPAKAIRKLLNHLVKGDKARKEWIINWLAYFFQGLKKSPVALVLKGLQGAGKGILYENILVPLFGEKQSIQVNDKSMKGNFIGGIVEGRLVINLDEISTSSQSNKDVKNQIKALVSNKSGTFEKKFQNIESETLLHAMILITTNEPRALDVESKDRRFTVLSTGGNISEEDFLGYGSYTALLAAIEGELEDFALMLLNYEVDVKKATTALNTPEKEALVGVSSDRFESFSMAIKNADLSYFDEIDPFLLQQIAQCFAKLRFSKKLLKTAFNSIYGGDISTIKLLDQLRAIDSDFFGDGNTTGSSNGDKHFIIGGSKGGTFETASTMACNNIVEPIHPSMVMQ
jgi:hypothetical protein